MVKIPCPCPALPDGAPRHESDDVTLRASFSPHDALALSKDIALFRVDEPDATSGDILAVLTEGYIIRGVESWTLTDAEGKPIPVSRSAIREHLLSALEIVTALGEVADEQYAEAVMLPLLRQAWSSSQPTPTDTSTSAPTDSGTPSPTPLTRSSTSTTRTVGTGKTSSSSDGGSSSSRSSESAA